VHSANANKSIGVLCVGFHFSHTHTHTHTHTAAMSGDLLFSLIHNNNDTVIICRAFYSTVLNHSISFIMIATRQDVYLFFLKDIHRKTAHKKQQLQRPLSCHWITNGSACNSKGRLTDTVRTSRDKNRKPEKDILDMQN
jgi:hypothetical protein